MSPQATSSVAQGTGLRGHTHRCALALGRRLVRGREAEERAIIDSIVLASQTRLEVWTVRVRRVILICGALAAVVCVALTVPETASAAKGHVLQIRTEGQGVVRSDDRRVVCVRCSVTYRRGGIVAVTAKPARYFKFKGWTGDCVGSAPRCLVPLDHGASVKAIFEREEGLVDVTVRGSGSVVSQPPDVACGIGATGPATTCFATFPQGDMVRLLAVPTEGQVFDGWTGCRPGLSGVCHLLVEDSNTVTATFRRAVPEPGPPQLTVVPRGPFAIGQIRSIPAGIDCPQTCAAVFPFRTYVTLHGPVALWSGACTGSGACNLVVDGPTVVEAHQSPPPPPPPAAAGFGLSVSVAGPGRVESRFPRIRCGRARGTQRDCQTFMYDGETVVLRAVPARRGRFVRWSGFCRGQRTRVCRVRATAPKTVLAVFRRRR